MEVTSGIKTKRYRAYKNKRKTKNNALLLQDVGSYSGDETKVTVVGIQGKYEGMSLSDHANTSAIVQSSSIQYDKK